MRAGAPPPEEDSEGFGIPDLIRGEESKFVSTNMWYGQRPELASRGTERYGEIWRSVERYGERLELALSP